MRKYAHQKYTWSNSWGTPHHYWELVGEFGGLHFSASFHGDDWSCGLEIHSLAGEGAPNHVNCRLTGGRCWHDGTSLYARETLWPRIEDYLKTGDHDTIFRILEREADKRFGTAVEAAGEIA